MCFARSWCAINTAVSASRRRRCGHSPSFGILGTCGGTEDMAPPPTADGILGERLEKASKSHGCRSKQGVLGFTQSPAILKRVLVSLD